MGSKSALLKGDLGEVVLAEAGEANRFVDLFAGSGSVSHFVSERVSVPVLSVDLQEYARVLTGAITERTEVLDAGNLKSVWTDAVAAEIETDEFAQDLPSLLARPLSKTWVEKARRASRKTDKEKNRFITDHYGGHYFSPRQAYTLDLLYERLPEASELRTVALAAMIHAASACAAAPGHTAQPFQPTERLLPHIRDAWSRDVIEECKKYLDEIASRHALVAGRAVVADAEQFTSQLMSGDVVFCDPPYSAAQYSRFYHVLEGIATGGWPSVTGAGRSPERVLRASSDFSLLSKAAVAMELLLDKLFEQRCRVIITFPAGEASNGLSGNQIAAIANKKWAVEHLLIDSTHSTLGGSSADGGRGGRRVLKESLLLLSPKKRAKSTSHVPSQSLALQLG